ncbi:MAG: serine/threonine-protein kinase, partial [Myxococcota bacterium]
MDLDRFELKDLLGEGSTGRVVRGYDRLTGREVALKFVREPSGADAGLFLREFRLLACLTHPNLVKVHELWVQGGMPVIVMEFLDGPTLERLPKPLEEARVRSLGAQLASALGELHDASIVHADVKPSNIHVLSGDRAVLVDLGFAVMASSELPPIGLSPLYAPPE